MANEDRDRDRYRDRGNRGMFGYEGEGYMRGGDASRGRDRGDFGASYPGPGYRGENFFGGGHDTDRGRHSYGSDSGYGGARGYSDFEGGRPSFRGRGPKNYQRSDERIMEEVCERLTDADDVDASNIEVSVSGGTVMLSGAVNDRFAKRRAEDIAEMVPGVKDVQNTIRVSRD